MRRWNIRSESFDLARATCARRKNTNARGRSRPLFLAMFFVLLLFASFHPEAVLQAESSPGTRPAAPERILSITPTGTEILYALGLGDRVVGVTKYCTWPPEALSKPRIVDMMHVNMEWVVGMRPDLVVISDMNETLKPSLESLGYPVVVVRGSDFGQICESIPAVGRACGVYERAVELVRQLKARVHELSSGVRSKKAPRVLVVVGRDPGDPSLKKLYVAGPKSFYNDLLKESRAVNAFSKDVPYAQLSREGLLRIDPDVLLELVGEHGSPGVGEKEILSQWRAVKGLSAVKKDRVVIISGDFTLRAGPRYPLILEAFIKAIHP